MTSSGIFASRSICSGSTCSVRKARRRSRNASPFSTASGVELGCGWIRSRRKLPRNSSLPNDGLVHSVSRLASATCLDCSYDGFDAMHQNHPCPFVRQRNSASYASAPLTGSPGPSEGVCGSSVSPLGHRVDPPRSSGLWGFCFPSRRRVGPLSVVPSAGSRVTADLAGPHKDVYKAVLPPAIRRSGRRLVPRHSAAPGPGTQTIGHPARPVTAEAGGTQPGRMLITRARTTTRTPSEIIDCSAIRPLTRRVNGRVSVGLNATRLVNATYR